MDLKSGGNSFAFQMGLEIKEMKHGKSKGVLKVNESHQNTVGLVHGGVLCTMADTLCGAAVMSGIETHRHPLTMDLNISFLKAAKGKVISGEAATIHLGNRTAKVECSLMSEDILIARAYATFIIVDKGK